MIEDIKSIMAGFKESALLANRTLIEAGEKAFGFRVGDVLNVPSDPEEQASLGPFLVNNARLSADGKHLIGGMRKAKLTRAEATICRSTTNGESAMVTFFGVLPNKHTEWGKQEVIVAVVATQL